MVGTILGCVSDVLVLYVADTAGRCIVSADSFCFLRRVRQVLEFRGGSKSLPAKILKVVSRIYLRLSISNICAFHVIISCWTFSE